VVHEQCLLGPEKKVLKAMSQISPFGVISFFNFLLAAFLGILAFVRSNRNRSRISYGFFAASLAFYAFFYSLWQFAKSEQMAELFFELCIVGVVLINNYFVQLTHELLGFSDKLKKRLFVTYVLNIAFCFCALGPFYSAWAWKYTYGYWPIPSVVFHVYLFWWFFQAFYCFYYLWVYGIRRGQGRLKQQCEWVFWSSLIGFAGGASNWFVWYGINFPPYLNGGIAIYALCLAYAIVRYRIMDIQLAVTRTGILVLIYGIVIGIPVLIIFQMREFLERQVGVNWWLVPAGLFSLLSFIGPFLYMIVQRRAEAVLSREQKAYQQTLLQASRGMTLIKDLNHLLTVIVHILTKTIRITHARIFLSDSEGKQFVCKAARGEHRKQGSDIISETAALIQHIRESKAPLILDEIRAQGAASPKLFDEVVLEMEKLDAAVIVPSFVQDRLLGFVVLGDKKSKRLYTESDLDTLATLANQAALAIENCLFLSEFENQQVHFFQTAKMADLGTMASGISHQVNNRFNTIGLGAEYTSMTDLKQLRKLMGEKKIPELGPIIDSLEDTVKKIRDDAMKGGEIAENLLHFSKKTEGFQAVDLSEAVQTCLRLWGCKRDLSVIDLENSVSPDLPKVRGNFSQVEEVLFNLLDNAYDAIHMKREAWELGKLEKPEGEWKGKVSISARPFQRKDKGYLEITIQDNGLGMDAATRQHIFLPFFTTKGSNKGTGLGLYVMKRIVEAHKGEIELESKYGAGTTFRVFFHQAKETDHKL
jgi:signal transduction histidine kinase